jgi:hypothetical protein
MAIYTTLFLCKREELLDGFPGWSHPLPEPVRREFENPFTGTVSTMETREPEWPDDAFEAVPPKYQVVAISGSFEDYLENRLPPFVRAKPHWATKGLSEEELGLLAQAVDVEPNFESPLFAPPSSGATLRQLPPELLSQIARLDDRGLELFAEKCAVTMSPSEAKILRPIVELARRATDGQRMYLLIEA